MANKKIVCLGGGIGTSILLKGLKEYPVDVTVIASMADDGGSSGRLRRLYDIFPLGDLVTNMAVMSNHKNSKLAEILTFRFPGNRFGSDGDLAGHKLGNLIMVAARDTFGNFQGAIDFFKEVFEVHGNFYGATEEPVKLSAITIEGKTVSGEHKIDFARYRGKREIEKIFIEPNDPAVRGNVVSSIMDADIAIIGPGDLYTNTLPVAIIPKISDALKKTKAKRVFVINVANKPFETSKYGVTEYLLAYEKHLGFLPFDFVLMNENTAPKIPKKYKYTYVEPVDGLNWSAVKLIKGDFLDEKFPLYHDSGKLAKAIFENI